MNFQKNWTKFLTSLGFCAALTACSMQSPWQPAQNQQYGNDYTSSFNPAAAPSAGYYNLPNGSSGTGIGEFTTPYMAPSYAGPQFNMIPPTPGPMTGTEVGMKIEVMRNELANLQANIQANSDKFRVVRQETEMQSQGYHGLVGAISARLQVGTTPGNPILVQQWNEAQAQLDRVNENVGKLNNVATMVAANSTVANFMLESVKTAYSISGAVDEDHRQLRIMEDDINRTIVMVERLLKELSEDVARQTSYVSAERSNLTALSLGVKNGELYGMSLSNRGSASVPAILPSAVRPFDSAVQSNVIGEIADNASAPLVMIRFDKPNVSYEREVYTALSKALARRPDAQFNLVAVSPGRGNPAYQALGTSSARKQAEQVMRSLTDMGLSASRVSISTKSDAGADVNEVHLYIR